MLSGRPLTEEEAAELDRRLRKAAAEANARYRCPNLFKILREAFSLFRAG